MVNIVRRYLDDSSGAAMVEMAIAMPLLLVLTLGFVDFGYAFYQWNAAGKAVQVGARLAAISSPIPDGLASATANIPSALTNPDGTTTVAGDPVQSGSFDYTCTNNGTTTSCSCTGTACVSTTINENAFNLIYAGDDNVCQGTANTGRPGMCDIFPGLPKAAVQVEYAATGLGYWTRPGGPVPTITVSIVNHPFQFFFLGGLLGFANIAMPDMHSTVTGEDLSSTY